MDAIERLAAIFERFPGIGPRQARRFVQFLLRATPGTRRDLAQAVQSLTSAVHECPSCMRYHTGDKDKCDICSNKSRDLSLLAIVASDSDLDALEKSGTYHGSYFVLGGTIALASEKTNGLRQRELLASIAPRAKAGLKEIILAFPANPEGDFTALHVRDQLGEYAKQHSLKVTTLGRGLSTGSELEYADSDTLKNALEGRR